MDTPILHRNDLAAHVFDTACALNRISAMSHTPLRLARMDPAPCTTESIADARLAHATDFAGVLAAMLYQEYHATHARPELPNPPAFLEAPGEVQERFRRIAQIALGLSDPARESLAWHAAAQHGASVSVAAFLEVCRTAGEATRPEPVDPRRI